MVRPRLPEPDWTWRVAADPLPEAMDTAAERDAWFAQHGRVWSGDTLEKVFLVGLLSVVYAQVLPDLSSTTVELFLGLGAIVVVSTAIGLWVARGAGSRESFTLGFLAPGRHQPGDPRAGRLAATRALPGRADMNWTAAFFFVVLLSLLTTLHDRYRPVHDYRTEHPEPSEARRPDRACKGTHDHPVARTGATVLGNDSQPVPPGTPASEIGVSGGGGSSGAGTLSPRP